MRRSLVHALIYLLLPRCCMRDRLWLAWGMERALGKGALCLIENTLRALIDLPVLDRVFFLGRCLAFVCSRVNVHSYAPAYDNTDGRILWCSR